MPSHSDGQTPVVEFGSSQGPVQPTVPALQQRIRQQEILAELGVTALQGASFDKLLDETARLTAQALRAEFSKVLEYIPSEDRLPGPGRRRLGRGVVGMATVGADLASPAGLRCARASR